MKTEDAISVNLAGKTCIITGSNGGIGWSVCEHFLALGANVFATDLGEFSHEGELDPHEGKFTYESFDLLDVESLHDCRAWVKASAPDVLFNNAAIFDMGSILEANLTQYDRIFDLNVRAMYAIMQAASISMVDREVSGSIINMSSQAGHRGEALVPHYCASKAAVISYTQSAALALAPHNIRVNAISPGVIDTPMWGAVDALFAKYENRPLGEKKRLVGEEVPMGHMGQPSDVARAAVFLASDQSAYITAQTLCVDGGNVLR